MPERVETSLIRHRPLLAVTLILATGAVGTPRAQSAERFGPPGPGNLPANPFCRIANCGFGRDGIPAPYTGGGLVGESAQAVRDGRIAAFESKNTTFLSWLSSQDLGGEPMTVSDVWGYTSESGREYALVGMQTGTAFVEVSNPGNPEVVGFVAGAVSNWRDMAVYRRFAYSVNESGNGLQIIDLREIDAGVVKLRRNFTGDGLLTSHNVFVNQDSGTLYLLGSNLARGGLVAVDVSSPARPRIEPIAWDAAYVHDAQVVTLTRGPYRNREVAFAFTGPFGLHIIDVTDRANPVTLSHLLYENATYGHSGWVSDNHRYLYINDELDERSRNDVPRMTTYVVRIDDLEAPALVRRFESDTTAIDHNSMIRDGLLYVASYTGGLRILDIEQPRRPKALGFFDTHPDNDDARFTGAWGIYAGFESGTVLVSDVERGLFVLRAQ